jgi:hypothetical protein
MAGTTHLELLKDHHHHVTNQAAGTDYNQAAHIIMLAIKPP